jgi:cytochrome c biogenesis protein CcmG/thiol:disulfide interchange protein DsbE
MSEGEEIGSPAAGALPVAGPSLLVLLPLVGFAAVAALLYGRLGTGDPSRIPSALIGKPVPDFAIPLLSPSGGATTLSDADFKRGHPTIVNVFASWCEPCHEEHPVLVRLAGNPALDAVHARLLGLAYKDQAAKTAGFLAGEGNPYAAVGMDLSGRVGIDWGVYGVPETFIVRGDGTISYKFVGVLTQEAVTSTILPELAKAAR